MKEENKLVPSEPKDIAPVKKDMLVDAGGMSGFEESDLPIPMVKLVTNRSDETLLQDGTPALAGQFYHTGNKETINPFIFRILAAAKGESFSERANNGAGGKVRKIVFYGRDEKSGEVFFMPISSLYAYWEFKKRVLPILAKALKTGCNIADVILVGDKAVADNKTYGKIIYPVFNLSSIKPLEEPLKSYVLSVQGKFRKMALDNMGNEDNSEETATDGGEENRNIDDVQLPA